MMYFLFFFKQKTAYEMRISDWSSDVCSSDLFDAGRKNEAAASQGEIFDGAGAGTKIFDAAAQAGEVLVENQPFALRRPQPIVQRVVDQRIADRGGGTFADGVAKISASLQRIAGRWEWPVGAVGVSEEDAFVERDVVESETVAPQPRHIRSEEGRVGKRG